MENNVLANVLALEQNSGETTEIPDFFLKLLKYMSPETLIAVIVMIAVLSVVLLLLSIVYNNIWTLPTIGASSFMFLSFYALPQLGMESLVSISIGVAVSVISVYMKYRYLKKKKPEFFEEHDISKYSGVITVSAGIVLVLVLIVI